MYQWVYMKKCNYTHNLYCMNVFAPGCSDKQKSERKQVLNSLCCPPNSSHNYFWYFSDYKDKQKTQSS